jgi:phosphoenolpyruvate carboxykinase (GTP)
MVRRIEGAARGDTHAFGVSPGYEDLNWGGLDFTPAQFEQVISVDAQAWRDELVLHAELFGTLAQGLPEALQQTRGALEQRLGA